jgi:ATP-dependent Clp protease ATP-binding subunit ClpA
VIETAFRLASDMQHRYVGTGHLLLGLITEADGATVAVFMEKEVTPDRITAEIDRLRDKVGPED